MININLEIEQKIIKILAEQYNLTVTNLELQPTRKEFEGDITLVVFPLVKALKQNPDTIAQVIGDALMAQHSIKEYNIVKGFLNLILPEKLFIQAFKELQQWDHYAPIKKSSENTTVMVEYCSPNTNKPIHLGHIRNILLGYAVSNILEASGIKTIKTQIINDRGIHICKSMLAWQQFGNGETPESTGLKGDKLVGKYYVIFDTIYKKEIALLLQKGITEEIAQKEAPIMLEAKKMLQKWEANDPETVALWKRMNQWVYDGFEKTYKALGIDFDFIDYESQTYLLGKDIILENLEKGILYQKEDTSIWCNLQEENLDDKLLLRADGTAVYMTQDLGTAIKRHTDYPINQLIYTVGNEQNHHFQVLFTILKKMGYQWAEKLYHLSYGMVNLADGSRMKSREGTVVDADDLIAEMIAIAKEKSHEAAKLEGLLDSEKEEIYRIVGLGALKYFILKIDPKKTIKFDPEKTIDFNGNTGPFLQYTYARIQSLLRNAKGIEHINYTDLNLQKIEKELLQLLLEFPHVISQAATNLSPALIANYIYELVKNYNNFYQNQYILKEENTAIRQFRLDLSHQVGIVIKKGLNLLGIEVPERM